MTSWRSSTPTRPSATYGKLITSVGTDQQTVRIHHTEYVMPASGMLFANDHDVGRTFIFDVNDPLHPKGRQFFHRPGGLHASAFVRAAAQWQRDCHRSSMRITGRDTGKLGATGGLVEIDDSGKVVRSASTADPAVSGCAPDALRRGRVARPGPDRVHQFVHARPGLAERSDLSRSGGLSDLKLLKTAYFDPGAGHYAHIAPEEPRVAADGSVYVQTLGCGIERITGLASTPVAKACAYLSGQLVRRPHDRGQLPDSIRARDPWP
jgi:hypothetical protein